MTITEVWLIRAPGVIVEFAHSEARRSGPRGESVVVPDGEGWCATPAAFVLGAGLAAAAAEVAEVGLVAGQRVLLLSSRR